MSNDFYQYLNAFEPIDNRTTKRRSSVGIDSLFYY
jgi:hypothetical protein